MPILKNKQGFVIAIRCKRYLLGKVVSSWHTLCEAEKSNTHHPLTKNLHAVWEIEGAFWRCPPFRFVSAAEAQKTIKVVKAFEGKTGERTLYEPYLLKKKHYWRK